MKKNEKGILAVETSIVLTFCVMLMLFLFSFARVYSAQSLVGHAVIQACDAVAMESYVREVSFNESEDDVVVLANRITGAASLTKDNFVSLREADVASIAKEKFTAAVAKSETEADEQLKKLGVKNGLAGVDLSASTMELGNDDVIVFATYTIELQFPVLGLKEIPVTKAARSKTFGDILFGIQTLSSDPIMGSASGGGNYKHGTQVQIVATPKYGYEFIGWADGSGANPRTVTVAGAATYVANFRAKDFGVNLECSPGEGGTASGGGTFKYLTATTINATPATGYSFKNWEIYRHEDRTTSTVSSRETPITVNQTYTCKANFKINSYTVTVKTQGASSNGASVIKGSTVGTSVTADYKTALKLSAAELTGYRFLGWKEEGAGNYFSQSSSVNINVPAKNVTYVACYEVLTSISLSGGSTNVGQSRIDATYKPSNATVTWSSSNSNVVRVDNSGNITATGVGSATITAKASFGGKTATDTVTINVNDSKYEVVYCMNMANGGIRFYHKEHKALVGTGNYIRKNGKTYYFTKSKNHHCHSLSRGNGCCGGHSKKIVGYTFLDHSNKVASGAYFANGKYCGYNMTGEIAYVADNGTGDAMYFNNGLKEGPGGYYFNGIRHN